MTVIGLLDSKLPSEIQTDEVLELSGISKGSLYHHFEDLHDLIETAQVARYGKYVDDSINYISQALQPVKTPDELRAILKIITQKTQKDSLKSVRLERARVLSYADRNLRLQGKLQLEVDRLTDGLEDIMREVMERGIFKKEHSARALAVFIQAYTLGKLVDDFSSKKLPEAEWNALIDHVIDGIFING